MDMIKKDKVNTDRETDDKAGVFIDAHLQIKDKETGKIIVNKRA